MRQALALAMLCPVIAGCSLIYNPNNLPAPPAESGVDADNVQDANPLGLALLGLSPTTIDEGQGDLGSAPAMIVMAGHNIIDSNTKVELVAVSGVPAADTPMIEVGAPTTSRTGDWLAFPVTARVDGKLARADKIVFDVKVSQTDPLSGAVVGPVTLAGALTLQGLDELEPKVATLDTSTLVDRYSKVDLSAVATLTFKGTNRAVVVSRSSIKAKGLAANGLAGGTTGATSMSVGGCGGGGPGSTGGCDGTIGGKGGTDGGVLGGAGGGGGGGFATEGVGGTGNGAGIGGSRSGDELLSTLDGFADHSPNHAAGGGGSGKPTLGSNAAGGGGGGTIVLDAGGDLSVQGTISLNGGPGEAASTGGGGGAGGVALLRAGGALAITGAISVNGGGGASGGTGNGGAGAHGRVRWDAANGAAPTIAAPAPTNGTLHRGPAFNLPARVFRGSSMVPVALVGAANDRFLVYQVHDGDASASEEVVIGTDGTASPKLKLQPGLSQLCVTIEGGQQGSLEATRCIDVAYLP